MQRRSLLTSAGATVPFAYSQIPDVVVYDQLSERLRFFTDLVDGKVVVINFFFVGCGETCPLVSETIRATIDLLGPRVGSDIFFHSIALKPESEPLEYVRSYAEDWDAVPPGWRFLRAEPADTEVLRRALGFASIDPDLDKIADQHTGMLRIGNPALDRWTARAGVARPEFIAKSITTLMFPGGDARPEDRIGA